MEQKFLKRNEYTANLYYDLILVEHYSPILFTCIDRFCHMYLVSCHASDANKCEWIITKTEPETIIKMLKDEITIQEAITIGSKIKYIATQLRENKEPTVNAIELDNIPETILPTEGYYMDADDDEFSEEIIKLEERVKEDICIDFATINSLVSIKKSSKVLISFSKYNEFKMPKTSNSYMYSHPVRLAL